MSGLLQDLRQSGRLLLRYPGFALAAVLTLGLGIGGTSAVFSIVNSSLLEELPFSEPDQLVVVWERNLNRGFPFMYASPPNVDSWRESSRTLESVGAFVTERRALSAGGAAVAVRSAEVSPDLFGTLRVTPQLGTAFEPSDAIPGGPSRVILSDALWKNQFGGDSSVLGTRVDVDGAPATVVGVMRPGFAFPPEITESGPPRGATDMWLPLRIDENVSRAAHYLTTVARLADGVTLETAQAELQTIAGQLEQSFPETNADWDVVLRPLHDQLTGSSRGLFILLGAVSLVLVIGCFNVANLLLARAQTRRGEVAVRAALGATRGRLIQQFLAESVMLGVAGGVVGLVIGQLGLQVLVQMTPDTFLGAGEASLDATVVVFTIAISLVSAMVMGLTPAWTSSAGLDRPIRESGRGDGGGPTRRRVQTFLIAGELALSLTLLVGGGLLLQTFFKLRGAEVGVNPDRTFTASVPLPEARYPDADSRVVAYRTLAERINELPELEAAGFIYDVPLTADRQGTSIELPGDETLPNDQVRITNFSIVTPGYFASMGIPMRRGRDFEVQDQNGSDRVAVVNEAFARQFYSGADPTGERFSMFDIEHRIVGEVGNVRHESMRLEGTPVVYILYDQSPFVGSLALVARARGELGGAVDAVRREVRRMDPGIPVYDVTTMRSVLAASVAQERFSATLMGTFSAIALGLAAIGVFGVVSYVVGRRVREIGIRLALGARRTDVLWLLVRQSLRPVLVGIAVGIPAALLLAGTLRSRLYGVGAADPLTLATVVAVLLTVALMAVVIPARRATRSNPVDALRAE